MTTRQEAGCSSDMVAGRTAKGEGCAPTSPLPPGPAVTAAGWLMALWCVGFAAVNLVYGVTGHFDDGAYAEYATGIAVMSYLVLIIKLVGAAVAVLAIRRVPLSCSPRLVGMTLWGAAALLALYSAGNIVQLAGMLTEVMGSRDEITVLGLGYVFFFILGAIGFGMLAVSFSRRYAVTMPAALVGVLGAPMLIAVLLVGIPLLLAELGMLPS
jgi:hypothetical protein